MTVRVSINGAARELATGTTVADVVAELAPRPDDDSAPRPDDDSAPWAGDDTAPRAATARGIAVAVNDEVVPRAAWPRTQLAEADRIEVLTAMQGG